ncbi:MAG TPA: hypothetical protein ENI56_00495 [Candidatus Kaiserbacteria bacterium]|nr:hypothetical protein [Candidatus Kaiserbacteria bacterium]
MKFFPRIRRPNFFKKKAFRHYEIAPDEIFLDATNVSGFDRGRFQGRLELPIPSGAFVGLFVSLGVIAIVILLQAGKLEIVNGSAYAKESRQNHIRSSVLFAPRGIIVGVNGTVLVDNKEDAQGNVRREYLFPQMGSIIGYVSYPKKDSSGRYYDIVEKGIAGLEAQYNTMLTGSSGTILTEVNAVGKIYSQGTIVPSHKGKTLLLSIDAKSESALTKALSDVAKRNDFQSGGAVLMNVRTGAIRAIASYPTYNANVLSSGYPAKTIASYSTDTRHPYLDQAVQGLYAPGSIVKPFIAAGALTDGIITPNTTIDDKGFLIIKDPYHPGKIFLYKGWKALGVLAVRKAIAWSSDVFFYTVGGGFGSQKGLGIKRLDYWYHQFGIGDKTGVDLPNEREGLVPTPAWKERVLHKQWYLGDTYFTAIGQYAMLVTPIQMARAIAAVANGGKLLTPTLLADASPKFRTIPVSHANFKVVREGMREAVTSALAWQINFPYLAIAAKTGTAQVGIRNQYDNSWIEGFYPYSNPHYAFAVVLGRGPSGKGEDATTVMKEFFQTLHAQGLLASSTPSH